MKIIQKLFGKMGYTKRSGTTNPAQWLVDWVRDGMVASGANVTKTTALQYTPFWSAVRTISGTLASLPFIVYRRTGEDSTERAREHPVFNLLHNRPNEYMDALTFIETRQSHVLTYGNGFAEIQRNGMGKPIALWPLLPDRTFRKISEGGIPYYEVHTGGETAYLPDANVLHIKGLGFDGYTGYDVVSYHKESIGYGIAVREYGSKFFGNSANPGGILEHPEVLSKEAAERLAAAWNKDGGLSQSHRTKVLEEGMKWHQTGVDPEKAQALETQKYTVDDCARIFNIPPHKLASMEHATFSNIEEQNIDFVSSTMLYWFRKWEQECDYKLFTPAERKNMYCEIKVDGLLRGNMSSRSQSYATGRQWGWLSINDIRRMENMNPIGKEGDIYLDPLNMKPAGTETPQEPINNDPPVEPEPDAEEKNIREAHLALLKSQWDRVIKKRASEDHAMTILFDPSVAYGSLVGAKSDDVRCVLSGIITDNSDYKNKDSNELAKLTMDKIGGKHAG